MLPRIALTLGDVSGIGPEVIVRAWCARPLHSWCRPVVVGHPEVVRRAVKLCRADLEVRAIANIDQASDDGAVISCWNPAGDEASQAPAGQNDARAGRAAYECLVGAARAAFERTVDAVATAPLSKAALRLAGLTYPGHTEILAE
ncbi:MAG TPA: 4-hydroxythreonine-4-phosphate dehydrogenase PdxA, partial [Planctomycetaceae bacterium]|nr:4-hydroxythreonine-4-phosphate dehydrogenase PdxA [Planctomycetaceae bacterium]